MHRPLFAIFLLLLLQSTAASACQICIPTRSAADQLIAADVVALPREDPDKPFSLAATNVLKGELAASFPSTRPGTSPAPAGTASGNASPPPRRSTPDPRDPQTRFLVARPAPDIRVAIFALPLLDSTNRSIRALAHIDVGSASYSQIHELGNILPRTEVRAFLNDFRMIEWHALYILLLAQSGDSADLAHIKNAVHSALRFSTTTQLAAWTTAFIETREVVALEFIRQH